MIFEFGRYKNQDVREVAQTAEGEAYCKWLVKRDTCPESLYNYLIYDFGLYVED